MRNKRRNGAPLLALLALLALAPGTRAQSFVEIGEGTETTSFPFYAYWDYSWTSQLYTSQEMGGAKTITHIGLNIALGVPKDVVSQKLYLKNLGTSDVYSSTAYEAPAASGYSLVFDGSLSYQNTGWFVIDIEDFEYDGTSSLSLHAENHAGATYYGPSFYATASSINNKKFKGDDNAFPTTSGDFMPFPNVRSNVRFYYQDDQAPSPPDNPMPQHTERRASISTQLSWTLGGTTNAYSLYFGTDSAAVAALAPSARVVQDAAVSAPGTYSYDPGQLLEPKQSYFWRVVATDGTNTATGSLWKFRTEAAIQAFPWSHGFEEGDLPRAFMPGYYADPNHVDWTYPNNPINWNQSSEANARTGAFCAYNTVADSGAYALVSPRVVLPDNHRVSFWWRNGAIFFDKVGINDTTYFEVSTDGGQSWASLGHLAPAAAMPEFEYAQFSLADYASDDFHFRFRYHNRFDNSQNNEIFVDDILIDPIPSGAELQLSAESHLFPELSVDAETYFELVISNTGTQDLVISELSVDMPFWSDYSGTIAPGQSQIAMIGFSPSQAGEFFETLTVVAQGISSGNTVDLTGSAYARLSLMVEGFDVSTAIPQRWTALDSPTDQFSATSIQTSGAFSAPNCARILALNDLESPLIFITPGLADFGQNRLKFQAKKGGAEYELDLVVGLVSDPQDPADFSPLSTFELTTAYQSFTVTVPEFATGPYLAFKHGGADMISSLWIDDVIWESAAATVPNPAQLVAPADGSADYDIYAFEQELQWATGGGSPTGYKVFFGTSEDQLEQVQDGSATSFAMDELEFSTEYFWQVQPYNQQGDAPLAQCPVWSFTTMDDPTITVFPWEEGFDLVVNTTGSNYPLGWAIENTNGDNVRWDVVANTSTPDLAISAPNAMHVAFNATLSMDDWLFSPPLALSTGYDYELAFWFRAMESFGTVFDEKMEVKLGTSNKSAAMNTLELFNDDFIDNIEWEEATSSFRVEEEGTYFIGFHGYSDPFKFLLLVEDVSLQATPVVSVSKAEGASLSLFPNPADDFVSLAWGEGLAARQVRLFNAQGQLVEARSIESAANAQAFDLRGLASGLYFLRLDTDQGTQVRSFVKR